VHRTINAWYAHGFPAAPKDLPWQKNIRREHVVWAELPDVANIIISELERGRTP
jgi:hypothetical protein